MNFLSLCFVNSPHMFAGCCIEIVVWNLCVDHDYFLTSNVDIFSLFQGLIPGMKYSYRVQSGSNISDGFEFTAKRDDEVRCYISLEPPRSQDLISNSPYWMPFNSYDVKAENLVFDQLIIPLLMFFFILIAYQYWYCKEKFCLGYSRENL